MSDPLTSGRGKTTSVTVYFPLQSVSRAKPEMCALENYSSTLSICSFPIKAAALISVITLLHSVFDTQILFVKRDFAEKKCYLELTINNVYSKIEFRWFGSSALDLQIIIFHFDFEIICSMLSVNRNPLLLRLL